MDRTADHRFTYGTMAAAIVLVLSSCAANDSPGEQPPDELATPSTVAPRTEAEAVGDPGQAPVVDQVDIGEIPQLPTRPASPIEMYRLQPREAEYVYSIRQQAMQSCMNEQGFEFTPATLSEVESDPVLAIEPDDVVRYGYGIVPGTETAFASPNVAQMNENDQYRRALIGDEDDPLDGCVGFAETTVSDRGDEYYRLDNLLLEAELESIAEGQASTDWLDLAAEWSRCMNEQGYSYSDPFQPIGELVGAPVTERTVDTRIADIRCQAETQWVARSAEIEYARVTDWLEQNPQLLEDIGRARTEFISAVEQAAAEL